MIRIICREVHIADVALGGAPSAPITMKTFDVDLPELEEYLKPKESTSYNYCEVVGVELIQAKERGK